MKRTNNTKIRQLVVNLLQASAEPIGLHELHQLVRRQLPSTAFSTVYRIARSLEDAKIIVRADWRERGSVYEWADRPHHHHIVCVVCGAHKDIDDQAIFFDREVIERSTEYTVGTHHFALDGICPACQQRRPL